ncbi:pilus assembly protein, partial [Burkholderia pseudomallei]
SERAREALEEVLSTRAAHVISDDPATVNEAVDQGVPLSRLSRNCGIAHILQAFARQLAEDEQRQRRDSTLDAPFLA